MVQYLEVMWEIFKLFSPGEVVMFALAVLELAEIC